MTENPTADPFDLPPLDLAALDRAWKSYNHGSTSYNHAADAMKEAGVTAPEACRLLDAPQQPSQGYLARSEETAK